MKDEHLVIENFPNQCSFFAIYDGMKLSNVTVLTKLLHTGHGGTEAVKFVKETLHKVKKITLLLILKTTETNGRDSKNCQR